MAHLGQGTFTNLKNQEEAMQIALGAHKSVHVRPIGDDGMSIVCPADVLSQVRKQIEGKQVAKPLDEEVKEPTKKAAKKQGPA